MESTHSECAGNAGVKRTAAVARLGGGGGGVDKLFEEAVVKGIRVHGIPSLVLGHLPQAGEHPLQLLVRQPVLFVQSLLEGSVCLHNPMILDPGEQLRHVERQIIPGGLVHIPLRDVEGQVAVNGILFGGFVFQGDVSAYLGPQLPGAPLVQLRELRLDEGHHAAWIQAPQLALGQ